MKAAKLAPAIALNRVLACLCISLLPIFVCETNVLLTFQVPVTLLQLDRLDDKQCASVLNEFAILRADLNDPASNLGVDRRKKLHHFDQAKCLADADDRADLDERWRLRIGRAIESSNHWRGNFDMTRGGFNFWYGGAFLSGRGRRNRNRRGALFDVFGRCSPGGAIPPNHEFYIACLDDKLITGTAVDELYDLSNLIVCQAHVFSYPFGSDPASSMVAVNRSAVACRSGTCCKAWSSDMRASGAEIASAATRCPPVARTGTATHTTPARNSWLSVEISVFRMPSSSASSFATSVKVFSVYR